jgi:hypothetical protein
MKIIYLREIKKFNKKFLKNILGLSKGYKKVFFEMYVN